MDLLKKALLVTFYMLIILVGVAGFLILRSLRSNDKPFQPDPVQQERPIVNTQESLEYSNSIEKLTIE